MAQRPGNPKVDAFIGKATQWRAEYAELRRLLLDGPLTEDLKWGVPCYTLDGKNIVLMHGFRDYCALLFPKGALLKDPDGILIRQTENVQAARQIRFADVGAIVALGDVVKAYVGEAIEVERAGLEVARKTTDDFAVPEEFRRRLDGDRELCDAFAALTPGRQRGYLLYFASARQSKTREARIEKCVRAILDGKGLDDGRRSP